ncbi:MAG: prolipoprotein diacylglyceryl transferase [Candidatus Magasanikbacteria bacterium]|nr:prolipoprotein diacylglyceryl transferase [Candidatus Magasanikbacteria bacterium]USN52781.1 MAG: prolipoprotein diacylglyceryl transferase [Candidatus Nomurabacteria bacterium]
MIPYLGWTSFSLGPITIYTWGLLVAIGYLLGTYIAYRRAKSKGLDAEKVLDLSVWIFIASFVGARLLHVLFYDDGTFWAAPLQILDPRHAGFSMFGGLIGAAVAALLFFKKHKLNALVYADTLIWGLPWGCGVGRIGCFLIHDHPGTLTHSLLGVRYPNGDIRHDHGLYLSLIGFATGLLFLWMNRKQRHPGFWLGSYLVIEGVTRFVLDFYRIADKTYYALTPTQWLAMPMFFAGMVFVFSSSRPTESKK